MGSVVHIVGAPSTGKTALRQRLARDLDLPSSSIDDERIRILSPGEYWPKDDRPAWAALRALIDGYEACIVETSGVSQREPDLLAGMSVLRISCTASPRIRAMRLQDRALKGGPLVGNPKVYVNRLLGLVYVPVADLTWNSERSLSGMQYQALIGQVAAFIGSARLAPVGAS